MAEYKIREAQPHDIESIIDLCGEHAMFEGAEYDKTGKGAKLNALLFSGSFLKCVVVESDNEVKGYVTYMKELSTWDAAYYMHMDCLYLRPEMRGSGIGRQLVEFVYSEAKASGCIDLQWQTPEDNDGAIEFYKKVKARPRRKVRFYLGC